MSTLKDRDKQVIWHPYTQMQLHPEAIGIVKGEGAHLFDEHGNRYIDAISSWWVNLHGHAHPHIAERVSGQMKVLNQIIFAGFTHEPAVELAEKLLSILPASMSRIFYSDNGSTAVEVAIKMALQYWKNIGQDKKRRIIALEHAYHGDTFGAMSVSGRSVFTKAFADHLFEVDFIPFPYEGEEETSINALNRALQGDDAAAFIAEPLIQGSAGMQMYQPDILRTFFRLCSEKNVLVIADEVMTGFGRTGKNFACDHIDLDPDLICLSKGLTGGIMPLGVTACSEKIYNAFLSDDRYKTFFHGHSFTANPLACTAALASLELLVDSNCQRRIRHIAERHKAFAETLRGHERLKEIRQCGTILAMEIRTEDSTSYLNTIRDSLYDYFISRGLLMRPLGNVIYIMPPYCIEDDDLSYIYTHTLDLLNTFEKTIHS